MTAVFDEQAFAASRMPAALIRDEGWIDLGDNHAYHFSSWKPDRAINPQFDNLPDIERCGMSVVHVKPDGRPCMGYVHFDSLPVAEVFAGSPRWKVESWEPLTLSPSLLCKAEGCGDHGFVRDGRWVRA